MRLARNDGHHLVPQSRGRRRRDKRRAFDDGDVAKNFDRHEFLSALIFHGSPQLANLHVTAEVYLKSETATAVIAVKTAIQVFLNWPDIGSLVPK